MECERVTRKRSTRNIDNAVLKRHYADNKPRVVSEKAKKVKKDSKRSRSKYSEKRKKCHANCRDYPKSKWVLRKVFCRVNAVTEQKINSDGTKGPKRFVLCMSPTTGSSVRQDRPKRTFLASLANTVPAAISDSEARNFRINFKVRKEELSGKLFRLYNSEIFGNGLPTNLHITWNSKMRGEIPGHCHIARQSKPRSRAALIELSTKVVDRADLLRDTLLHEMCHAATWVIDGIIDNHGPVWRAWTRRARERFPELPPSKLCSDSVLNAKYVYKCNICRYFIRRSTKSDKPNKYRCPLCQNYLQLVLKDFRNC